MEEDFIKLSIIIPVYNTPVKYLQECLESIRNANINYKYEVLIIDDGSTNGEIISFFRNYKQDNIVTILFQENKGPSSARNTAIKSVKGEYILF
ncbi:glycosyltransferase family 2 protein [Riemerella anatipestifer]|nr:glycosyltransferase [Riemerella anatipestifer]MBT0552286.1 glycosyltransferase [Riemerella anatipestifer]MBT0554520.1 glycosyltransferase [Riemerella anatipestifer]MCE3025054.1 glycosyltransferase [Riemerella anatipestifer]MCO4303262.1 glycosyltransferase [Riemerella anatipestifer]MCQ4038482.1 glycosyltransferase [Riemerella anatipestifer]